MSTVTMLLYAGSALFVAFGLFMVSRIVVASRPERDQTPQALQRLDAYLQTQQEADIAELHRLALHDRVANYFQQRASQQTDATGVIGLWQRLARALERADLQIRPDEFVGIVASFGAGIALLFLVRFNIIVAVAAGLISAPIAGVLFINMRARKRRKAINEQLADAMVQMANSLRAGHSFTQAMTSYANTGRPPLATEFGRANREIQLGLVVDDALRRLVRRNDSEDLEITMSAITINRVTGGNLADIFDIVAETIRERVRLAGEIQTLTTQARLSGWIISLLPLGLGVLLNFIAPSYFNRMVTHFLGWVMIGGGLISMAIGIVWMRNISNIDI